jgi:hypothetical protein
VNQAQKESKPENNVEGAGNEIFNEEKEGVQIVQDSFRHVLFGQIADGILPPCQGPQETDDDELSRAALSDPAASVIEDKQYNPTPWRVIFLLVVAAIALAIVFWK